MNPHTEALEELVGPALEATTTDWGIRYAALPGNWVNIALVTPGPATSAKPPFVYVASLTYDDLERHPVTTQQLRDLLGRLGADGARTLEQMTGGTTINLSDAYRALNLATSE